MNILLFAFLVLALAVPSRQYYYDKPAVSFQQEDAAYKAPTPTKVCNQGAIIIKGNNGKDYEVTMTPSKTIFETSFPPVASATLQTPKPIHNENFQQPLNFNSNQYNSGPAVNNEQNLYTQFAVNSNHQQQQQAARAQQQTPEQTGIFFQGAQPPAGYYYPNIPQQQQQQQQQFNLFPQNVQQQVFTEAQSVQQQQYYEQPNEHYVPQPPSNSNLPSSNNPLNDLINNHKYISQSEASQLNLYPYTQINSNPRPFTRTIIRCDVVGQCEPQNPAAAPGSGEGSDFHHQQVLKQSKAQVEPLADTNSNKFDNHFAGNPLMTTATKNLSGTSIKKGVYLRDRRLFPYCEVVIDQYPHN